MDTRVDRRGFLGQMTGYTVASISLPGTPLLQGKRPKSQIGLAMHSLNPLFKAGELSALDYPSFARKYFGISKLDVWPGAFPANRRKDPHFFQELKKRADAAETDFFLLMDGALDARGATPNERTAHVTPFHSSVNNASLLGAKFVRIFLIAPDVERQRAIQRSIETLAPLATYAKDRNISLILQPGIAAWSKQGAFLADLCREMSHSHCRLAPDFTNMIDDDIFAATRSMLPFSDVVVIKTGDFDADGNALGFDYPRLMQTIVSTDFQGIITIHYRGTKLSPKEGVKATKQYVQRLRQKLSD